MKGLAQLLGFEWVVNESGQGCEEFVRGTEFDHISQEDLDRISRVIRGKYSGVFKLSREQEALIKELGQEKEEGRRKKLEEDRKKIEKELSTFSVSADEVLKDVIIDPAALARATLGGLEVLVPVDRSEAPYGLLPGTIKFLRPKGQFDKQQIFDLSAHRDLVFSRFAAPYEKKGERGIPFVELHLTHDRLCWTDGYTTGGRIERIYASGEIASATLVYQFDVLYDKEGDEHLNIPTAESSVEVSFHGKNRGVTHTYKSRLQHNARESFPYLLLQTVRIENRRKGLEKDLLRETEVKCNNNAENVREFVAAFAETVKLVPHREALEAHLKKIATTYRGLFDGELQKFEHHGLKLGPEGYLVPEKGLLRRLLGL